ncbi:MAG: hypothetical protein GY816_04625 [Cytophagales bacterium]|nr:hypothetical protein [Cytophagales bacterium]
MLLGVCFLVGNSFIYSFGKISHGWLVITLLPFVFSFSNWGAHYSIDSKINNGNKNSKEEHWPLAIFAGLSCIAMFSAGLEKLFHGWLFLDTEKSRYVFFRGWLYERPGFLTEWVLSIQSKFFCAFADYSIVIFELIVMWAVWKANLFRGWIVLSMIFHFSVYVFMGFTFTYNMICYLVFFSWNFVLDQLRLRKLLDAVFSRIKYWHVAILIVIAVVIKWNFRHPYILKIFKPVGDVIVLFVFSIAFLLTVGPSFIISRQGMEKLLIEIMSYYFC